MLQQIDLTILQFFTQLGGNTPAFDQLVVLIVSNDLVKGGPILAFLWWFWFKPDPAQHSRREIIISCMFAALIAAAASRGLAHAVMIHQRPFLIPGLLISHPMQELWEDKASSFPSDHAALAFALVTGLFLISRKIGLAMGVYALALVGIPRMYLGIHWPSDVLGGVALGIGMAALLSREPIRTGLATPVNRFCDRSPHAFYVLAFFMSFGMMTRFDSARALLKWAETALRAGIAGG